MARFLLDGFRKIDPKDAESYGIRGGLYMEKNDFARAIANFNAEAFMSRGLARLYQRNDAAAELDFKKSIELKPELKAEIEEAANKIRQERSKPRSKLMTTWQEIKENRENCIDR